MKAKNRTGIFDLLVQTDEMIGTRAYIYVVRSSTVSDRGNELQILGYNSASFPELKGLVDSLKHDLDVDYRKDRPTLFRLSALFKLAHYPLGSIPCTGRLS